MSCITDRSYLDRTKKILMPFVLFLLWWFVCYFVLLRGMILFTTVLYMPVELKVYFSFIQVFVLSLQGHQN